MSRGRTSCPKQRTGGYWLVTTVELSENYRKDPDKSLLVDTRQEWEYRTGHIKGIADLPPCLLFRAVGKTPAIRQLDDLGSKVDKVGFDWYGSQFHKAHNFRVFEHIAPLRSGFGAGLHLGWLVGWDRVGGLAKSSNCIT
jgi:hypothetical protein